MKKWQDIGYTIEYTQDSSPTLRLNDGESMHHSAGAFSESEFIYGKAIDLALSNHNSPAFLVVGLGLAYIEMLIAVKCIKNNISPDKIKILSFESNSDIRETFLSWLWQETDKANEMTTPYNEALKSILTVYSGIEVRDVKQFLQKYFPENLKHMFTLETVELIKEKYHAILYDAYSSKTTPELWGEDFLNYTLMQTSDPKFCIFASYAAKGTLIRALKFQQFTKISDQGFSGKRNSSLYIKKN